MSSTLDLVCCLPVLLLWLGPLAVLVYCVGFGGCSRLLARYRRRSGGPGEARGPVG